MRWGFLGVGWAVRCIGYWKVKCYWGLSPIRTEFRTRNKNFDSKFLDLSIFFNLLTSKRFLFYKLPWLSFLNLIF